MLYTFKDENGATLTLFIPREERQTALHYYCDLLHWCVISRRRK